MQDSIFSIFEIYTYRRGKQNTKFVLFALPPNSKEEFAVYVVVFLPILLIGNIGKKTTIIRTILSTIKSYVTN